MRLIPSPIGHFNVADIADEIVETHHLDRGGLIGTRIAGSSVI